MSIPHYYTPQVSMLSPDDLRAIIQDAMRAGAEILRQELALKSASDRRMIAGRKAIMEYLGIRNQATLRERIKKYPEAFVQEGRTTLLLDTTILSELKRREGKMTRKR